MTAVPPCRSWPVRLRRPALSSSQDTLDSANALNDKVDTLKATVKGFAGKVGSELAGRASKALDVVGSHFSKAFNVKPMDWMNSKLDGLMSAIDGWISSGGLDAFADKLVTGVQTAAQKAGEWLTKLKDWIASGGLDTLAAQLAGGVQQGAQIAAMMIDKAAAAMQWCQAHTDTLVSVLKVLAGVWGIGRVVSFVAGIISAGQTIGGFIKTVWKLVTAKGAESAAWIHEHRHDGCRQGRHGGKCSRIRCGYWCHCRSDSRTVGFERCLCSNANRLDRARPGSCCGRRCGAVSTGIP